MKKISFLMTLLVGLLVGCIRDPVQFNKIITIENKSGQDIKLSRFAKENDSYGDKYVDLKSSEKKEVFAMVGVGKVDIDNNTVAYWGNQNTDSVIVTFAGNIKVTHLNQQIQLGNRKNLIPFNDSRNILNPKNYKVSPVGGNYTITYTFTEQDYLNTQ